MKRIHSLGWAALAWCIVRALWPVVAAADTRISGAGSSFDYPFFSRAFYEYSREHAGLTIDYASIGSGGGIQQFLAKTIDFGASDVPLNAGEMRAAQTANGNVVQVPVALGGVVIAYNVAGAPAHVRLTAGVLVDIFLGKVTNWNAPAIARSNAGTRFPNLPIVVVHRADGSGTTYILTDYLARISAQWRTGAGVAKSVNWPAAASIGAKGNEGVAGQIRNTPGAIGYIELTYALENNISYAAVQNTAREFVLPSLTTVRAAAAQKPNVSPEDFSIVNQPGKDSYPISGYSWAMLWQRQADAGKARELVNLFRWLVTNGQKLAGRIHYVPLPPSVQKQAERALQTIRIAAARP